MKKFRFKEPESLKGIIQKITSTKMLKGGLKKVFSEKKLNYCFFSFSSDWLFPTSETKTILTALKSINAKSSFMEINTDKGHDAFLLDEPEFHLGLKKFITGQIKEIKL